MLASDEINEQLLHLIGLKFDRKVSKCSEEQSINF